MIQSAQLFGHYLNSPNSTSKLFVEAMLESFSCRATSAEELKALRSCPEVLAIADGVPENASIATSTVVNAIFL